MKVGPFSKATWPSSPTALTAIAEADFEEPSKRIGVQEAEPLPPVKFAGKTRTPDKSQAEADSADGTQLGSGNPFVMTSLPSTRLSPHTLKPDGQSEGQDDSAFTQTKEFPGRPGQGTCKGGQPFQVEVILASNMQARKNSAPDPGAHCKPPGHRLCDIGHDALTTMASSVGQVAFWSTQGDEPSLKLMNGHRLGLSAGQLLRGMQDVDSATQPRRGQYFRLMSEQN